jgi:hypothetical protein
MGADRFHGKNRATKQSAELASSFEHARNFVFNCVKTAKPVSTNIAPEVGHNRNSTFEKR